MNVPREHIESKRTAGCSRASRQRVEGLQRLYKDYRRFAERVLRQSGVDACWMDDALQDVFLAIVDRYGRQASHVRLSPWIFGICRNVAHVYMRRRSRWAPISGWLDTVEGGGSSPEDVVALRQARRLLDGFLDDLDPKKRDLFVMSELGDVPSATAANRLGINVHTAYARLRVARASFAKRVQALQLREARLAS